MYVYVLSHIFWAHLISRIYFTNLLFSKTLVHLLEIEYSHLKLYRGNLYIRILSKLNVSKKNSQVIDHRTFLIFYFKMSRITLGAFFFTSYVSSRG